MTSRVIGLKLFHFMLSTVLVIPIMDEQVSVRGFMVSPELKIPE